MSPRNPTFIVKNCEGSSYLFRVLVPLDLRSKIHKNKVKSVGSKEFRISLLTGLKSEATQLAQVLKIKADSIFKNIRSGNISGYCVKKIKAELKAHLYQIRSGEYDGAKAIEELKQVNYKYYHQHMERNLTEDYIRCLKFKDFEGFCKAHDIEYKAEDYPKKGLQLQRLLLSKKVDEEIKYHSFAKNLARDILIEHLSNVDFVGFRDFFHRFEIDDEEFMDIYDPQGDMSTEQFVFFLEKDYDIIPIARKIGVRCLFEGIEHVYENDTKENDEEPLEKVWNGLKSTGKRPTTTETLRKGQTPKENAGNVKKLSTIAEEFINENVSTGVWNPKSEKEKRASIATLIEIIGDIYIDELSYEVGREFKNTLIQLPANRNKIKKYRDLSIPDVIKTKPVPMSPQTVNNQLSTIIALMNWTRKQGYIKENFFEGLKLAKGKQAQDERKSFSDGDLKRIFDSNTYKEATNGNEARYWVPLLGLYTGARLNEICQLHVKDIKKEDDLWCVHITAKGGTDENFKRLKNKASERLIPLHDKLIELGFIDYVTEQKKSKVVRLFPELSYTTSEGYARKVGRWFNDSLLRKKLGITEKSKSFHSFRHTVADHLKQKGVAESFIAELLGHSSGETMSFGRYGKKYLPRFLNKTAVSRLEYPVLSERI